MWGDQTIEGEIRRGEGFDDSLKRSKVRGDVRIQLIQAFSGTLDFRDLKPKDRYSIALDDEGKLIGCTYESDPLNIYRVFKSGEGYAAEKALILLEVRTEKLEGVIESSMFEAMVDLGEEAKLIYAFANIFASRIDFNSETQPGDRFSLVFEKYLSACEGMGKIGGELKVSLADGKIDDSEKTRLRPLLAILLKEIRTLQEVLK